MTKSRRGRIGARRGAARRGESRFDNRPAAARAEDRARFLLRRERTCLANGANPTLHSSVPSANGQWPISNRESIVAAYFVRLNASRRLFIRVGTYLRLISVFTRLTLSRPYIRLLPPFWRLEGLMAPDFARRKYNCRAKNFSIDNEAGEKVSRRISSG